MIILPIFQQEGYTSWPLSHVREGSAGLGWRAGAGDGLECPLRWSRGEVDKTTMDLRLMDICELTEGQTVHWREESILCGEVVCAIDNSVGAGWAEEHGTCGQ